VRSFRRVNPMGELPKIDERIAKIVGNCDRLIYELDRMVESYNELYDLVTNEEDRGHLQRIGEYISALREAIETFMIKRWGR